MRLNPKTAVFGLGAALLVAFAAFGYQNASPALAHVLEVRSVPATEAINTFVTTDQCGTDEETSTVAIGSVFILAAGTSQWFCIDAQESHGDLTVDSNDVGVWDRCLSNETAGDAFVNDPCEATTGLNTDLLIVLDSQVTPPSNTNLDVVLVRFTCPAAGGTANVNIEQADQTVGTVFTIQCRTQAGGITLTANPTTIEIVPAPSNTAHSLIQVLVTDAAGAPILVVPGTEVDFTVNQGPLLGTGPLGGCAIEETNVDTDDELFEARGRVATLTPAQPGAWLAWDDFANEVGDQGGSLPGVSTLDFTPGVEQTGVFDIDITGAPTIRSMAAAILHCDVHAGITNPVPGIVTVQACIDVVGLADICKTVQVTVIGPPASITVAASPTSVRCGEKSTITVTVKDAVGQNVSDHTLVELVSNLGGTIGGTGAVAGFAGPVVPISSSVAGTFGGVATAFLLTSETHTGPYEVVATTGGTAPGNGSIITILDTGELGFDLSDATVRQTTLGGIFSTPPISAEVTVTCSLPSPTVAAPAATVSAPRTGTGVLPPNTGDAGLKDSSSSWALFAIAGMAAFALAGLATVKFARR